MGCCIGTTVEGEFFFYNPMVDDDQIEKVYRQSTSEFNQLNSSSSIIVFESARSHENHQDDPLDFT